MAKANVSLHLSPISLKWAFYHLGKQGEESSIYRKPLRKLIDLMVEELPKNINNPKYHTEEHVIILLPNRIRPSLHSGRWRKWWIPPDKMKQLDDFITAFWKNELTIMVDLRKNNDEIRDLDVILDFHELYDISDDELSTYTALKIIQRAREKQKRFYLQAV